MEVDMRRSNGSWIVMAMACVGSLACSDNSSTAMQPTGAQAGTAAGDTGGPAGAAGMMTQPTAGMTSSSTAGTRAPAGRSAGAGSGASATSGSGGQTAGTTAASGAMGGGGDVTEPGMLPMAGMSGAAGMGMPTEETCNMTIPPSMDCAAKLAPGDERECTLGSRKYIVHAGKTMNPCKKVPLVIDAHGATETMEQQLGREKFCSSGSICWAGLGSGWAAESDTDHGGFIAVFPQGNNNMWSASDADFMLKIVDEMKKLADIDTDKVYISGISNGGFLTFQTGCPHSDVFKGMAPNAGGSSCSTVKAPIPLISFDAMPDFAYDGHKTANMSVVRANNCKGSSKPWLTIDGKSELAVCRSAKQDTKATIVPCNQVTSAMVKPTTCVIWDECDGGVKVAWCDVSPNTEHGASNAALDAHILYENDSILNTPSLAWHFFKMFWK
jgi:poly(3-hydroxybutyrate) depolymerase